MENSPGESFQQFVGARVIGMQAETSAKSDLLTDDLADGEIAAIPPISLAYVGDAVFELYVRSHLLIPAKRIRDYHQQVVAQVKAEQQSRFVDILGPHLTDAEKDLIRKGRNATTGKSRRASAQDYQKATGLETLIGFLYLTDQARLFDLLNRLTTRIDH